MVQTGGQIANLATLQGRETVGHFGIFTTVAGKRAHADFWAAVLWRRCRVSTKQTVAEYVQTCFSAQQGNVRVSVCDSVRYILMLMSRASCTDDVIFRLVR